MQTYFNILTVLERERREQRKQAYRALGLKKGNIWKEAAIEQYRRGRYQTERRSKTKKAFQTSTGPVKQSLKPAIKLKQPA